MKTYKGEVENYTKQTHTIITDFTTKKDNTIISVKERVNSATKRTKIPQMVIDIQDKEIFC